MFWKWWSAFGAVCHVGRGPFFYASNSRPRRGPWTRIRAKQARKFCVTYAQATSFFLPAMSFLLLELAQNYFLGSTVRQTSTAFGESEGFFWFVISPVETKKNSRSDFNSSSSCVPHKGHFKTTLSGTSWEAYFLIKKVIFASQLYVHEEKKRAFGPISLI